LTILVLLDTNAYLRFAKRLRPLLGRKFGQKDYELTVLKAVEDEVRRSPRLKYLNPWFEDIDLAQERDAKQIRLTADEKSEIKAIQSVLQAHVLEDILAFSLDRRSPPGDTDCWLLAFAQVRDAIVVTDDLGMQALAKDFGLPVWHSFELLDKLRSAKHVDAEFIRAIYAALEANQDMTKTWADAKHTTFIKVFGKAPS
jgi:predicted nuclease of predicted toxin-antitoxin system